MKGNYSTHDSVAGEWCYRGLFPDTPYAYDSGGDPKEIPNLTYEDFLAFHGKYYHPSNTLVYLYGNTPTEEYLEFLDRRFLSRFEAQEPVAPLVLQPRWTQPRRLAVSYPAGEGDSQDDSCSITLNWLLFPVEDSLRLLSWEVLTEVLMGSAASPLQKLVSQSSLGDDLSPTSGFESELRETVFSVGIQGTGADKAEEVERLFLEELRRIVREGLNTDLVEGILRKFEFRSREIKGGGPFGLRLLRKLSRAWLHGAEAEHSLLFERHMTELRNLIGRGTGYLETLIQEDLLDNPHRTTVTVYPDAQQNEREAREEAEDLASLESGLSEAEKEAFRAAIQKAQEELEAFQSQADSPEDMAKIPFLSVTDIPREVESIPGKQSELRPIFGGPSSESRGQGGAAGRSPGNGGGGATDAPAHGGANPQAGPRPGAGIPDQPGHATPTASPARRESPASPTPPAEPTRTQGGGDLNPGGPSAGGSGAAPAKVWYHDLYTNGITYLDIAFDLSRLTPQEQLLVPLFAAFVPSAGLPGMGYEEVSRQLAMVSGGFSAYPEVNAGVDLLAGAKGDRSRAGSARIHSHLFFRLKALDSTAAQALGWVQSLVAQADFTDLDHLAEVFFEMRNDMKSSILPGGSSYASLRAEAGLHPVQDTEERLRGLTQYLFLEELAEPIAAQRREREAGGSTPEGQPALWELAQALTALRRKIISAQGVKLNITAQAGQVRALDATLARWLGELPTLVARASGSPEGDSSPGNQAAGPASVTAAADAALRAMELPDPLQRTEFLDYPSKVAYVAAAMPGAYLGSAEQAYEQLLAHVLKTGPLWEEIRMKGGAYGAHASSDGMGGIFSLASYRDPQTLRTLEVYRQTLQAMAATPLDRTSLDLAKIGSISRELKPLSPGEKGVVGFKRSLYGISDRIRQHRRDLTLSAEPGDLQKAAERLAQALDTSGRRAILAGKELLQATESQVREGNPDLGGQFGTPVIRPLSR